MFVFCFVILFHSLLGVSFICENESPETFQFIMARLFQLFDDARKNFKNVSKIKTIGDCYMAASGLFDGEQANNQHIHDIVQFGLAMIDCIEVINGEIEKLEWITDTKPVIQGPDDEPFTKFLRIRVGAACGGPICYGVMGIKKPSFDVWGDLIPRANMMEQKGTAMKLHVDEPIRSNYVGGGVHFEEAHINEDGVDEKDRLKKPTFLLTRETPDLD